MSTTTSVAQPSKSAILSLGLAWWDESPKRTTAQKVERAAKRFVKCYGYAPTIVYANPADCDGTTHHAITIKPARSIQRHQFYLCIGGAA